MATQIESENLRACQRFPGYFADEYGNVFSNKRDGGRLRYLRPETDRYGYLKCDIRRNGITKTMHIHSLVLDAWIGPKPDRSKFQDCRRVEARHLDGNKTNNAPQNLTWGTSKENGKDKVTHGTAARGEKGGNAKLKQADVDQLRAEYQRGVRGFGQTALAKKFNVTQANVWAIVNNKTWQRRSANVNKNLGK